MKMLEYKLVYWVREESTQYDEIIKVEQDKDARLSTPSSKDSKNSTSVCVRVAKPKFITIQLTRISRVFIGI